MTEETKMILEKMEELRNDVMHEMALINLTLENEISRNIKQVAEGHLRINNT